MSDEDDVILPKPLPFVGQIFGRGKRTGPPAESEADHFYKCGECNGWVDKRNLAPRDWRLVFKHIPVTSPAAARIKGERHE